MIKKFIPHKNLLPLFICLLFFIAYSTLGVVRHSHYQSFGYDLGINDQVVWRYAHFQSPISTIAPFSDRTKFAEHIEIIYMLLSPFYWIWSSAYMLILVQAGIFCSSGLAVYLLTQKYKLPQLTSSIIMFSYFLFYGVQFGLWTDVHSSVFAAGFFMWFIYFLDIKRKKLALLSFLLTLTSKESTATALFFVSVVYFIYVREKVLLFYMSMAFLYALFVFFVFFPYIIHTPYLYANHQGLLSNLNPYSLIDTKEKQITILYSFASWGFLPVFSPLFLLPVFSHFYKFFVIASDLERAHGLFGQYRIMLSPLFALGTIWFVKRFTYKVQMLLGLWLLISTLFIQYILHLPLSYLAKVWFWEESSYVASLNTMIKTYVPSNMSIVSQNNIIPHLSQRDKIYTLYPEKKMFSLNSPCGENTCNWFRWDGDPQYLIVDTAMDWDARHLLIDRPVFLDGLHNLETAHVIEKKKEIGTTILYKIKRDPEDYK